MLDAMRSSVRVKEVCLVELRLTFYIFFDCWSNLKTSPWAPGK